MSPGSLCGAFSQNVVALKASNESNYLHDSKMHANLPNIEREQTRVATIHVGFDTRVASMVA
jgi:hypothetical protein